MQICPYNQYHCSALSTVISTQLPLLHWLYGQLPITPLGYIRTSFLDGPKLILGICHTWGACESEGFPDVDKLALFVLLWRRQEVVRGPHNARYRVGLHRIRRALGELWKESG